MYACHGGWEDLRRNSGFWWRGNQHWAPRLQFPPPASDLLLESISDDSRLIPQQAAERALPAVWEQGRMVLSLALSNMSALAPGTPAPEAFGESHLQFGLSRVIVLVEGAFHCSMHLSMKVCALGGGTVGEEAFSSFYHLLRFPGWYPVNWADRRQINKRKTKVS